MTPVERIAKLEARMDDIDRTVLEIKEAQSKTHDEAKSTSNNIVELTGKLSTLTDNLQIHNNWHKEQGEKRFKLTDIILAVGMMALAIMQFVGTKQTQQPTQYTQTEKAVNP